MEPSIPLDHQRLHQAHQMMDFIDGARQASAQVEPPIEQLKEWVRTAYTDQGIEVDDALLEQALQSLRANKPLTVPALQAADLPVTSPSESWGKVAAKRAQDYLEAQPGGKFFYLLAESLGGVLALNVLALFTLAFSSLGIALANRAYQLILTGQPVDVHAFSPWTEFVGNLAWWIPYALPLSAACLTFLVVRGLARQHRTAWFERLKGRCADVRPTPRQTAVHDALFGTRASARATASAILKMRKEDKDSVTIRRPGYDPITLRRSGRKPAKTTRAPLR